MSSYTQVLLIPTEKYKSSSYGSSDLENLASSIQSPWNEQIEDSNGDYSLYVHADYSKVIDLSGERGSSACSTLGTVEDKVHTKYPNLTEWDAVLVADHHGGFSKTIGCAPSPGGGSDGTRLVAGQTDGTPSVGFADKYNAGSGLFTHELGHMYDGDHNEHKPWGLVEFTIMGNPGDPNCNGGTTSENRIRRRDFANCAESSIRSYIDHWHDKGYFNPQ